MKIVLSLKLSANVSHLVYCNMRYLNYTKYFVFIETVSIETYLLFTVDAFVRRFWRSIFKIAAYFVFDKIQKIFTLLRDFGIKECNNIRLVSQVLKINIIFF